jgi:hypothetical protein
VLGDEGTHVCEERINVFRFHFIFISPSLNTDQCMGLRAVSGQVEIKSNVVLAFLLHRWPINWLYFVAFSTNYLFRKYNFANLICTRIGRMLV